MPYPSVEIRESIPNKVWISAVQSWVSLLKNQPDEQFITGYIRETAKSRTPEISKHEKELRSLIFHLVIQRKLLWNQSAEVIWDFVTIYGPQNVKSTSEEIARLPELNSTIKKLSKLALFLLSEGEDISEPLAVFLNDGKISKLWVTDEWIAQLMSIDDPNYQKASKISQMGLGNPDSEQISAIQDMFPQLHSSRIKTLLKNHNSSTEELTSFLLENPDALEERSGTSKNQTNDKMGSVFEQKNHDAGNIIYGKKPQASKLEKASRSNFETTLRLIYQADEDEHDDTYDEAEVQSEEKPASSSALDATEKYLWQLYNKTPDSFDQKSRKSKQRNEMKKQTNWSDEQLEGWAKMLERNPRRKAHLEEKFMFRGNKAEMEAEQQEKEEKNDLHSETPERSSTPTTSNNKPNTKTSHNSNNNDARDRRRKEQNKAKRGNHNRKAGHAKKMNQMTGGQ